MTTVLLLDQEDSFTRNVAAWLAREGARVRIRRRPAAKDLDVASRLVLGPGPGRPEARREAIAILDSWPPDRPLLGVCLGCQQLAVWAGAGVGPGATRHGEAVTCRHGAHGLFEGVPDPFRVARYNSLRIVPGGAAVVTAREEGGDPLAIRVAGRPWAGILFHPDSHLSEWSGALARTFLS